MTIPIAADVVTAFIQAWNNKDLQGVSALLAAEVSGRNPLSSEATLSRDTVCSAIERMMGAFPDLHMRVDTIIADGATVAVEEFETATLTATNASYAMPVALFITVNSTGQITRLHNYWDTQSYFTQLQTTPEAFAEILLNRPGSDADLLSWQGWRDAHQLNTD